MVKISSATNFGPFDKCIVEYKKCVLQHGNDQNKCNSCKLLKDTCKLYEKMADSLRINK